MAGYYFSSNPYSSKAGVGVAVAAGVAAVYSSSFGVDVASAAGGLL